MAFRILKATDATAAHRGSEFFITDGTVAGTSLLVDINPGPGSSDPANIANGTFTATDGVHGTEIWTTNFTAAGTIRLDSLPASGPASYSAPSSLYLPNVNAVFAATDTAAWGLGRELYTTDFTAAGTVLLKDINPGGPGSNPDNFLRGVGNHLYFTANDGAHGVEEWVTDGTAAGTLRLDSAPSSSAASYASPGLFTHGTGFDLFVATDATATNSGTEVYVTNGTAAGTQVLKDINAGSNSSDANNFIALGAKVFFTANDGVHGTEEWVTDGTAAGTVRLDSAASANPASYVNPVGLINLGAKQVFVATDNTAAKLGTELYVTDGTAAGTSLLKDINAGAGNSNPSSFFTVGAQLFFSANDGTHGVEEWVTDGTAAGTVRLDAAPAANPATYVNPTAFTPATGFNIFVATDNTITNSGTEIYVTNGTPGGTSLLKDINAGVGSSNISNIMSSGAQVYFTADDGVHGVEQWVTNGTAATTVRLDPSAGTASYRNPGLIVDGGFRVFAATDNTVTNAGTELYVTNGTPAGTMLLKDINPGLASSNPSNFLRSGAQTFFTADDGTHGIQEWVTDGTAGGTVRLDTLPAGSYTAPVLSAATRYDISGVTSTKLDSATNMTSLTFVVKRSGDPTSATTLAWSVAGSGANAAVAADFAGNMLPTGTITFNALEYSKIVTVNVLANAAVHADKGFTINLATPSGMTTVNQDMALTTPSATGTILSNNKPVSPPPASNYTILDTTTNTPSTSAGVPYTGPVAGLNNQFIYTGTDNYNVTANTPNNFIHTGSGFDAIDVRTVGGTNVLDGGTNSNFLVGGTGAGSNDTFFVDDRSPPSDIWSTVGNFHAGDSATVFGITQTGFTTTFVDGEGAVGYTGVTLHVTAPGVPTASLTLAGYNVADLSNGRLTTSFGNETDGTPYFFIHANS